MIISYTKISQTCQEVHKNQVKIPKVSKNPTLLQPNRPTKPSLNPPQPQRRKRCAQKAQLGFLTLKRRDEKSCIDAANICAQKKETRTPIFAAAADHSVC